MRRSSPAALSDLRTASAASSPFLSPAAKQATVSDEIQQEKNPPREAAPRPPCACASCCSNGWIAPGCSLHKGLAFGRSQGKMQQAPNPPPPCSPASAASSLPWASRMQAELLTACHVRADGLSPSSPKIATVYPLPWYNQASPPGRLIQVIVFPDRLKL